jgi:hypothetical protein
MIGSIKLNEALGDPEYGPSYLSEHSAFKKAYGHQFFDYYATVSIYPLDICYKTELVTICSPRARNKARYNRLWPCFLSVI